MTLSRKPQLIILSDWFAPGYRAGGPITSCVNLSYAMRDYFDVKIITSDRDFGDRKRYASTATSALGRSIWGGVKRKLRL